MTIYVYIENNEINEIHHSLPQSWRNVSGFNLIGDDPEVLKTYNWYIVNDIKPEYDESKYLLSAPTFTFDGESVSTKYELEEIQREPPSELQRRFMLLVRHTRNEKLQASDWTMCIDMTDIKSEDWINSWKSYRQILRDFPSQFIFSIDDLPPAFESVIWPNTPEG